MGNKAIPTCTHLRSKRTSTTRSKTASYRLATTHHPAVHPHIGNPPAARATRSPTAPHRLHSRFTLHLPVDSLANPTTGPLHPHTATTPHEAEADPAKSPAGGNTARTTTPDHSTTSGRRRSS